MYFRYGIRLRELRHERKLTQEALAGLSGVSRPTIHRVENGQQRAHESTLYKLACALEVDLEDIDPDRFWYQNRPVEGYDNAHEAIGVKLTAHLRDEILPTIRRSARKYALNPSDVDDLESAGLMGLEEACRKFDRRKEAPLNWWLKFISTNRVRDEARRLYKNHPGFGLENQNIEPWTY